MSRQAPCRRRWQTIRRIRCDGPADLAARDDFEPTALGAAQLDESYQIERWGEDPEAARRCAAIKADLEAAARLFELLAAPWPRLAWAAPPWYQLGEA